MISRRQFITLSVATSGSLMVQIPLSAKSTAAIIKHGSYFDAWLEITPENRLIFSLDKVEMGQGVVNSLVAILAEELNTHPLKITVQLPVVGREKSNALYDPSWGTGASSSVRTLFPKLRKSGAVLNNKLLLAAARHWGEKFDELVCRDAFVVNPNTGKVISFADLIPEVVDIEGPAKILYKRQQEYQWVGKRLPYRDMEEKITGKALYCDDINFINMPVAVIVRCPYPGGKLLGYQWRIGEDSDGVRVVEFDNRLAVIGETFFQVSKAREKLIVDWKPGKSLPDNKRLMQDLVGGLNAGGDTVMSRGHWLLPSIDDKGVSYSAVYTAPYLAHAPLEPMNCAVEIKDGTWSIWVPTQKPKEALSIAARISELPIDMVSVHTTYVGGGFGRRLKQDYVVEACILAKILGHSVKVLWSREDDFRHGYYRPAMAIKLDARADGRGIYQLNSKVCSSEAAPIYPADFSARIKKSFYRAWRYLKGDALFRNQAIVGLDNLAYDISAQEIQLKFLDVGLPTGLWRSVGHSFNGFFIESFIDELAWRFKQDPIDYRLKVLKDPAMKNVLRGVKKNSHWERGLKDNKAFGVACYQSFGTSVAMVVGVKLEENSIKVSRVWCVIDCGLAIDPDGIRKQVEGSVNFGLCGALFGELQLDGGKVSSSNFHDYPVLRMRQSPRIEVDIVVSDRSPTGVGEPATPLVAPALYNAVYALTGVRYRELPLKKQLQGRYKI